MSFKRVANSIVTRLILVGMVLLLIGAVARYVLLGHVLREELSKVVAQQQEALAGHVARNIDYKIVERTALLQEMAQALPLALLNRPDALHAWLAERYRLQTLFSQSLLVTDAVGVALANHPPQPERIGLSYGDRDYLRAAQTGETVIGSPRMSQVIQVPVLPIAVPVKDAAGQVRAVLVGFTPLAAPGFLSLTEDRIGERGGFLVISPRDKLFVASTMPDMVLKATPPPGVNLLHDRAMAGYRGSGITVNARGVEEISAMASVPSTGWFVVARIPTSDALAVVGQVQRYVLANVPAAIAIFALMATGGLMAMFRPLLRAADHAERMTRGELPLEPLPVAREDEVGHLTHAFNRLLLKLQVSQSELERLAHHDVLTGLPNRIVLASRLTQVLARAQRNGTRLGVLYIDLDGFKPINDSLGHEAGDAALIEVAHRLGAIVRAADTLARVGGDEFMVVLEDLDADPGEATEAACAVANKCLQALASPFMFKGEMRRLGLSIGIALGNGNSSADALRTAADAAMYQAKQAGGQRYVVADDGAPEPASAPVRAAWPRPQTTA